MKKLNLIDLENLNGGISNKGCATVGILATGALFFPGGPLITLGLFAAMALADCDLF